MKLFFLSAALSAVCIGCTATETKTTLNRTDVPGGPDRSSVTTFTTEQDFVLESRPAGTKKSLHVKFTLARADSRQAAVMGRAGTFSSPEFTWLGLYLQNAAIRYMNSGESIPGVEISPARGIVSPGESWFLEASAGAQYGKTTLALKQGGEILNIVPDASPETDWAPLTPESYPVWWNRVDQRLGLTELFRSREPKLKSI